MNKIILQYFGPLIMCTAVLVQLFVVHESNLSRWKGAGMGMFSGLDERSIQVNVSKHGISLGDITEDVALNIPRTLTQYKAMPTQLHKSELLRELHLFEYFIDTNQDVHIARTINLENITFDVFQSTATRNEYYKKTHNRLAREDLVFEIQVTQIWDFDTESGVVTSALYK